jgi:ureidoglycolate dehydrogenase (NAD+)
MPLFEPADLQSLTARLFAAKGMPADDAATVAAAVAWADARGIASHGIAFVPRYLKMIDDGDLDPRARPVISSDSPAPLVIDAGHSAGAVAMDFAMRTAFDRASQYGSACLWLRDLTHAGAMGQYVEWAAERGAIAMVFVAGPPLMAYHGAGLASATTGPIAMAVPGPDNQAVVFDMATSEISFARLRQARLRGTALPPGAALDAAGAPTTDPALAQTPLPVGGPKGAGLALMFELMTSVLLANPIVSPNLAPGKKPRHTQNAMLMLARVDAFMPADAYLAEVATLRDALKALPRAIGTNANDGADEILLPGERRARARDKTATQGVAIAQPVWEEVQAIAGGLGVALPAARA